MKHEAQHARDLREYGPLPSAELEYRAKLVEFIYSAERNLLPLFAQEADGSEDAGGHARAAQRILAGFQRKLNTGAGGLNKLPPWQMHKTAEVLLRRKRVYVMRR